MCISLSLGESGMQLEAELTLKSAVHHCGESEPSRDTKLYRMKILLLSEIAVMKLLTPDTTVFFSQHRHFETVSGWTLTFYRHGAVLMQKTRPSELSDDIKTGGKSFSNI